MPIIEQGEKMNQFQSLKSTLKSITIDDVLVESILNKILLQTIKEYQQKVRIGIEDSVSDLLDNFKSKITTTVFDSASKWKIADFEPVLFPKNCRFCYTKGKMTIIVIEQDPQVRNLKLSREIVGPKHFLTNKHSDCRYNHYSLSLPYTVFLVSFYLNDFLGLYSAWRNSPLTSLDDLLYHPYLPNIHESLNVCMPPETIEGDNICRQSENAITLFWNSCFNGDLSSYWWKKDNQKHLDTVESWVAASKKDPLFILKTEFISGRSLKDQISLLTKAQESVDESTMRHQLEEQVDICVKSLFDKITAYFKKNKYEKHYPKEIKDDLNRATSKITGSLIGIIQALKLEVDKQCESPSTSVTPASVMWSEYVEESE
jgi:hypothetical protein